ncbi:4Fe-4S binding protein [Desulforhopalus sp. IMCC35007]|uniref:4Fe-4S binding protein n=1 Tax=Desulforhopalus sp. IMCC35007 TaxID=2569543 RepID=UPI0010ADE6E0|nr:4Fe-4S binding protein [Desulforhopalus sp. IMCC35007]TKB09433.1 4Fe-4S dicluster domain-containing protein [Desulforhopalus sp. IMCC35007]
MSKDYLFHHELSHSVCLGEHFDLSIQEGSKRYLISNTRDADAEIYAPEINWYFESSTDDWSVKADKLNNLYDARRIAFEGAEDVESSIRVGKKILVIADTAQQQLVAQLNLQDFTLVVQNSADILGFAGSLGNFVAQFKTDQGVVNIDADQVIWFQAPANIVELVGVHDPLQRGLGNTYQDLLGCDGIFTYRNTVRYIRSSCLQSNKNGKVCNRCVEICPANALAYSAEEKQILLSSIQCIGCGLCAGVCPTGALEYAPSPRSTFERATVFYRGSIPLIVSKDTDLTELEGPLPANILPLAVEDYGFLDEEYLLTLLQNSNHPILIYAREESKIQMGSVRLLNEIFGKIYGRQVIYLCTSSGQVRENAEAAVCLPEDLIQHVDEGVSRRVRLVERLSYIVGNADHGCITPDADMPYGAITINEEHCTLCLSCVDACTLHALEAHAEDNTLRFTPALCVQCGWCEQICPEVDCLKVAHGQLVLQASYFEQKIMAKDEIFNCVECGKGFAPAKSIAKIVTIMTEAFAGDPLRSRALSCCPDCKAKVMFESLSQDI